MSLASSRRENEKFFLKYVERRVSMFRLGGRLVWVYPSGDMAGLGWTGLEGFGNCLSVFVFVVRY
jgi:hypothetical protein